MQPRIAAVDVIPLTIPRDVPYLGPLEDGNRPDAKGHFRRPGNRTVYSTADHSTLVRITTECGATGWGECVAVVVPGVAGTIVRDFLGPMLIGRNPHDVVTIYEDMYDALRVRGFFGGFYHDAIAAVDIALWDLRGKLLDLPVFQLLGARRHTQIPAYVSGLPRPKLEERVALAREWVDRGFPALKFAAAVSHEGIVEEMRALREAVGPKVKLLVDLHWKFTAAEAVKLITDLERYDLCVAEAPVKPEDAEGQALVVRSARTPVGIGEELRTVYEYRPRFEQRCMHVIQPEMGRTGLTSFWHICQMAQAFHCTVMPHASIGIGIFQAASLHVSAGLPHLAMHEYQHSIFDKNLKYLTGALRCQDGAFDVPDGPGLGVAPNLEELRRIAAFVLDE